MNLKNKNSRSLINYNLGIQLLKMFLCFWVVITHTYKTSSKLLYKLLKRKFHVPTFFLISFFFCSKNILERNIQKSKLRFKRLLIPYILLPLIIWIVNNLLFIIFKFNRFGKILSIKELISQYIIGHIFHGVFWYQFNLIFITLIYYIISFLFKKKLMLILHILIIISYLLQYSGYNYKYFMKYKARISYSLGNTVEVFPHTVTGFFFGYIDIIKLMLNFRFKIFYFSIIYIYIFFYFDIFINIKGFYYPGLLCNIGAIILFICFSLIPFKNNINKSLISFIKTISNFTGGIYYFHTIIYKYIIKYKINLSIFTINSITRCFIIYLFCYIFCFIGIKIFGKTQLKYLFF
jgi:fucose 4-O-acetylase-like acetyltransferase